MRMNLTLPVFALGFLVAGLALRPALAATATASFTVSATVVSGCQATPNTQGFNNYAAATANAVSAISVACTQSTPYVVSLGPGVKPEESATTRKVIGSGSGIPRGAQPSLPQQAINRGRAFGAGTVAGADNSSSEWRTALERTAAEEHLAPGTYPDAIMVSITY
jgi:spore coat protein U-like protein